MVSTLGSEQLLFAESLVVRREAGYDGAGHRSWVDPNA
jgi:hypothetical protein